MCVDHNACSVRILDGCEPSGSVCVCVCVGNGGGGGGVGGRGARTAGGLKTGLRECV